MKTYSEEELQQAKQKLPKPTRDFLTSKTLSDLYLTFTKRHTLNISQLMGVSRIVNLTLLGLEAESAIETNLHQEIHTLTNQQTQDLVEDINTRIFKEARRRLTENITEPEEW